MRYILSIENKIRSLPDVSKLSIENAVNIVKKLELEEIQIPHILTTKQNCVEFKWKYIRWEIVFNFNSGENLLTAYVMRSSKNGLKEDVFVTFDTTNHIVILSWLKEILSKIV